MCLRIHTHHQPIDTKLYSFSNGQLNEIIGSAKFENPNDSAKKAALVVNFDSQPFFGKNWKVQRAYKLLRTRPGNDVPPNNLNDYLMEAALRMQEHQTNPFDELNLTMNVDI